MAASTDREARAVESHFIDMGLAVGQGGGTAESRFVYAYAITRETEQL